MSRRKLKKLYVNVRFVYKLFSIDFIVVKCKMGFISNKKRWSNV